LVDNGSVLKFNKTQSGDMQDHVTCHSKRGHFSLALINSPIM